jgi:hypothetical protein
VNCRQRRTKTGPRTTPVLLKSLAWTPRPPTPPPCCRICVRRRG